MTQEQEYRFGIPTIEEVTDPKYLLAVRKEDLNSHLGSFYWPTSNTSLHNHVVSALRAADDDVTQAERVYRTGEYRPGILAMMRGVDVRQYLDPNLILQGQLGMVTRYQETLRESEPFLGHSRRFNTQVESIKRVEPLVEGMRETRLNPPKIWGESKIEWSYAFNPWNLAVREIALLGAELEAVSLEDEDPIVGINRIWQVIEAHDKGPIKDLVRLWIPIDKFPFNFEQDSHSEVGRLSALNREIAARSDIAVRFDRHYLEIKHGGGSLHSIPLDPIVNPEEESTRHGIQMRTKARDEALGLLQAKGFIVVNGKTLFYPHGELKAAQRMPGWFVNLIGEPINIVDGDDQIPEDWAQQEARLVEQYRALSSEEVLSTPYHPIVERLLEGYEGFVVPGFRYIPREVAQDVLYALKQD